jgi:DNA adenine methylase
MRLKMKYMGSKNRIAKSILPIMLAEIKPDQWWVEPFVGGANIIDKVPNRFKRIGIDYNAHTIAALIAVRDLIDKLPNEVSVEYYNSLKGAAPDPITSLIRFGASFGGKFENGYARRDGKSMWTECVRNSQKQSPKLQGIDLINGSYDEYSDFENCLIYCDPPYKGTTSYKTGAFDHDKFWQWCRNMGKSNVVFVSEYEAPDDFICTWQGEVKTNFASQRGKATHNAVEKLFRPSA